MACRRVSYHVIILLGASALPRPEKCDCNPQVNHTSAYPGEHSGEWQKSCWCIFWMWAVALGLCFFQCRCLTLSWLRTRWRPSWASIGTGESVPCSGEIRISYLLYPPGSSSSSTNFYNGEKWLPFPPVSCVGPTGASTTRTIHSTLSSKRQTLVFAASSWCVVYLVAVALVRSCDTGYCSNFTKALCSVWGGVGHRGQLAAHVALITFMIIIRCTYSKHLIIVWSEKLVLGKRYFHLFLS